MSLDTTKPLIKKVTTRWCGVTLECIAPQTYRVLVAELDFGCIVKKGRWFVNDEQSGHRSRLDAIESLIVSWYQKHRASTAQLPASKTISF